MTVIHELARQHAQHGGQSKVVVGKQTMSGYNAAERILVDYPTQLDKAQKIIDAAISKIGMPRVFANSLYRPASNSIRPDSSETVFVHNAPAPIGAICAKHKK